MSELYPWETEQPRNSGVNAFSQTLPRATSLPPSRASKALSAYPGKNAPDYLSPETRSLMNYDSGLAATAAPVASIAPVTAEAATVPKIPGQTAEDYRNGYLAAGGTVNKDGALVPHKLDSGPSRTVANVAAVGGLGLGIAGYFDTKKTAKLQREALRQDITAARDHNARRAQLGASWDKAWS